jgi:hypothetical protein
VKPRPKSTARSASTPSRPSRPAKFRTTAIPTGVDEADPAVDGGTVHLPNLQRVFFPTLGPTKRDLLQYYLDVSRWLLPHLQNRAMVMKRYPNGIAGEFFFMKRAPTPRPRWIPICSIEHASGNIIGFPVIQHLASLLWVVTLAASICIPGTPAAMTSSSPTSCISTSIRSPAPRFRRFSTPLWSSATRWPQSESPATPRLF